MAADAGEDWLTAAVGRVPYKQFYAASEKSSRAAEAWVPRPDDVFIATYSKTGTTAIQQLVEMLRSGGDTNFDEITEVQPWLDFCLDIGFDPDAAQAQRGLWPRCFKSHQHPAALNRPARLLSIVREPAAVCKSYYAFYIAKDHPLARGKTLDEWAFAWAEHGTSNGLLWDFYVQLWQCHVATRAERDASDATRRDAMSASPCLLLEYKGLVADLRSHARRVALWLNGGDPGGRVDMSDGNLDRAARLSTLEYMSGEGACQFDDHFLNERQLAAGCETVMQPARKAVDPSRQEARPELSGESKSMLERMWAEHVAPKTGLPNFAAMAAALAEDHALWRET